MGYYNQQRRLHPHGSTFLENGKVITYTHNLLHEKLPYAQQLQYKYLPSDEEVRLWEVEDEIRNENRARARDPYAQ